MTTEEVKSEIDEIIKDILIIDERGYEYTPISKLRDDFGADSLDALEILMNLEREFNISIPNEEIEVDEYLNCTVQDIYNCVLKKLGINEEETK